MHNLQTKGALESQGLGHMLWVCIWSQSNRFDIKIFHKIIVFNSMSLKHRKMIEHFWKFGANIHHFIHFSPLFQSNLFLSHIVFPLKFSNIWNFKISNIWHFKIFSHNLSPKIFQYMKLYYLFPCIIGLSNGIRDKTVTFYSLNIYLFYMLTRRKGMSGPSTEKFLGSGR